VLLFIDKRDVRSLCLEHPQIALAALKVLAGRLRRCAELVETLSLREVGQRLARFLLAQARARGHTGDSFMPAPVNHRRPVLLGLTASAGLTALIIIGSRNLEHYDAALFGYTVASVVAFGAIIFRYVIWLQRPATRRYWLRGWQLFRERKKLLANTKSATATATKNLIAQKFIFKRGSTRWLIHFLIMWGCVLSALITFPLVFGWVHFKLEGAQGCRPYVFGFPMPLMQGEYNPPAETPDEEYPLILTSGRVVYQYLSGNQTRRIGFLVQQCPEPYVEVHPETAMKLKINDGEHVRVRSRRGEGIFPVLVVRTIRPDTIFIPYHWGEQLAANQLTNPALDPTSKIPEFNACAARIEKIHSRKLPIMGAQRKGASQSEAIRG
jgi:formylmethanofuran dehydrogenase subunit D